MKFAVLLSGCGVYDGAEIHESVLAMLAIKEAGADYQCVSVDQDQHHVVDHSTGDEMPEKRNMLVEAARIARGEILDVSQLKVSEMDALVIPGGFGSAKNFTKWAFQGPEGEIMPQVKELILKFVEQGKPICALCVSPTVVAKALQGSDKQANLTLGSSQEPSPYDIPGFSAGLEATGAKASERTVKQILVDDSLKIVTAPCYMMETDIVGIRNNAKQAIDKTVELVRASRN